MCVFSPLFSVGRKQKNMVRKEAMFCFIEEKKQAFRLNLISVEGDQATTLHCMSG